MKVMAFNARPDERAFFDHFSQSLDMDLTLQKDKIGRASCRERVS